MSQREAADGSPFRRRAWPLELLRNLIRAVRLGRIKAKGRSRFVHGSDISFAGNADVRAPHFIELGHHISFGKNFTCEADLRIGNYVLVSSNVAIVGQDHPFDDPALTVYTQQRKDDSVVTIGSDVLIGFGSIVVGTVTIGDGCIVGAGSVVVKDLPPGMVCVGAPARPVRPRFPVQQANRSPVDGGF